MAQKRMFSKHVTNDERFLEMPLSSQALYLHLNMNADDDGFVQPKRVLRMIGANDDDLKILLAKGFVLQLANSDNVMVITHWKVNNTLRKDRYTISHYAKYQKMLGIADNSEYFLVGCQNGNHLVPQDRIGKDRIDNIRQGEINCDSDDMPVEESVIATADAAALHKKFIALYFMKARCIGISNPTFTSGKDGALIKRMLKTYSYEQAVEMLNRYFDDGEGKFCGYTIGGFYSCLNKLQLKRRDRIKIAGTFAGKDEHGNVIRKEARF